MSESIFATKGGAAPSVTGDQAKRILGFGNRRVISLNGFARPGTMSREHTGEEGIESPATKRVPSISPGAMRSARIRRRRKFSLRLDKDLHRRFHNVIRANNTSGQKLLEALLRQYLDAFEESAKEASLGQS